MNVGSKNTFKLALVVLFAGLLVVYFANLETNEHITQDNIRVTKVDKHPFLIDHGKLIIVERDGKRIAQANGYRDPGVGCASHLFEREDSFLLIECNGSEFQISKSEGKIEIIGWGHMKDLPPHYLGTFERQKGSDDYRFVSKNNLSPKDVYTFKDPSLGRN